MIYALVHYPGADPERLNRLRRKYDPQFNLIAPHITIMFPVPDVVGEHDLVAHIEGVLQRWEPFPVRLKGLRKSWDEYLFLVLASGEADVIRLHDDVYSGPLSGYRGERESYVPHVTLGVFTDKPDEYERALKEAERLSLDYECVLDRLHLLKVNDERTQVVWSREFPLKARPTIGGIYV